MSMNVKAIENSMDTIKTPNRGLALDQTNDADSTRAVEDVNQFAGCRDQPAISISILGNIFGMAMMP
jgi:hypothetical protein